jgi:sirohydrochlorin cobaltochelatase
LFQVKPAISHSHISQDALIVAVTESPHLLSTSSVQSTVQQWSARLAIPAVALDLRCENSRWLVDRDTAYDRWCSALERLPWDIERLVIVPFGLASADLSVAKSALVFSSSHRVQELFLAQRMRNRDWADLIAAMVAGDDPSPDCAAYPELHPKQVILVSSSEANQDVGEELAGISHWLGQQDGLSASYALLGGERPVFDESVAGRFEHLLIVPWRVDALCLSVGSIDRPAIIGSRSNPPRSFEMLGHGALSSVLTNKFLEAFELPSIALLEDEFRSSGASAFGPAGERGLTRLQMEMNDWLPSAYSSGTDTVRPRSMGSAKLAYDEQGRVAWDKIWTSFCDLAMAGGPPHRGKLLEAITAETALRSPDAYAGVLAELERGITLASGLATTKCLVPGWVGVQCDNEEMAAWLLRAIIVENIMVRREESILYLPAAPHFALEREIKNVVTSVAKTVHYWRAHWKGKSVSPPRGQVIR